MDAKILQDAEKVARDEWRKSEKQPADFIALAIKLETIFNAGGVAQLLVEAGNLRKIARDVLSIKRMDVI